MLYTRHLFVVFGFLLFSALPAWRVLTFLSVEVTWQGRQSTRSAVAQSMRTAHKAAFIFLSANCAFRSIRLLSRDRSMPNSLKNGR